MPLNPRLTGPELVHVLHSVHPAVLVTTSALRPHTIDLPTVVLEVGAAPTVELQGPSAADEKPLAFDPDVALVQFTSGTTGRPKPVLLSHDGVLELLDGVIGTVRRPAAPGAPAPTPMPNLVPVSLSLWAGIYQVLFAFRVGAPVVVMETFEPNRFASLVREFGIRSTVLPPAAMTMLCDDPDVTDLSPLRYVRSITAPLSPLQARRFRDQFGIAILNGYGQTEIGGEIVGWSGADAKEWGNDEAGIGRSAPPGRVDPGRRHRWRDLAGG